MRHRSQSCMRQDHAFCQGCSCFCHQHTRTSDRLSPWVKMGITLFLLCVFILLSVTFV